MKRWMSATLALGVLAGACAPALADCPGHKVTADAGTSTPVVTADTATQPVASDRKG